MRETRQAIRRFILPAFLVALAWALAPAAVADASGFFDPSLGDFKAELATAAKEGKQGVLLMFEAEGCPYCRKMKEQVLTRPEVQAYYRKHFAIFTVDVLGSVTVTDFAGRSATEKNFAREQRVRGTPTFLFVGADGKEMTRYTGATRDAREFMELGRYIVEGHWRKQDFQQFYRNTQPEGRRP
jgi:thioredoxin-related protein